MIEKIKLPDDILKSLTDDELRLLINAFPVKDKRQNRYYKKKSEKIPSRHYWVKNRFQIKRVKEEIAFHFFQYGKKR